MRNVILLGASGNIGGQALDILSDEKKYCLKGFSVGKQTKKVLEILTRFPEVEAVSLLDKKAVGALQVLFPKVHFYAGKEGILELIKNTPSDMVVNALVGFAGLVPSILALEENKILCLSNKESLVVGGHLINALLQRGKGKLYPIDSEHVAFAKCLSRVNRNDVGLFLITASGGAFRDLTRNQLKGVTPEMALAHPTWTMGPKITIDCATMFNKGFEILEAVALFGIDIKNIVPIIHRESYVHSALMMKDGSFVADVGRPDMHGPIEYALSEGTCDYDVLRVKRVEDLGPYHFQKFNPERYPAVGLCIKAFYRGGTSLAVLNAADEEAVGLFLEKKIPFTKIEEIVSEALDYFPTEEGTLKNLISVDEMTRVYVRSRYGEKR